jgi:hypothetical protein
MLHAIIPDVHQDIDKLLKIHSALRGMGVIHKVYVGDWFDTWDKSARNHVETAEFLRNEIEGTYDTFILGNHDIPYAFSPTVFPCPGFTWDRRIEIRNYLFPRHWESFEIGKKIGSYWITHAGMHESLMHPVYGFSDDFIIRSLSDAKWALQCNQTHPWLNWGEDRGGDQQRYGGVNWLDFNKSFLPISGLNQIFGHSIAWKPRHIWTPDSQNYCIDTKLDDFIVLDDETDKVHLFHYSGIEYSATNKNHCASKEYKEPMDKLFIINSSKDYRSTPKRLL